MTRWARKTVGNAKNLHDATKWGDFSKQTESKPQEESSQLSENNKKKRRRKKRPILEPVTPLVIEEGIGGLAGLLETEKSIDEQPHTDSTNQSIKRKIVKKHNYITPVDDKEEDGDGFGEFPSEPESNDESEETALQVKRKQKSETRRLKRIDMRQAQLTCFHCRRNGHTMSNCPDMKDDNTASAAICFKCGSTEHTISNCRVQTEPGQFPYATCFVCNKMGHLSSQCANNPKGLYPNGGCCKICGSVEHFKKDCPEKKDKVEEIRLEFLGNHSVDEEVYLKPKLVPVKKKRKIVVF